MNNTYFKRSFIVITIMLTSLGIRPLLSQTVPFEYLKSIELKSGSLLIDKVTQPTQSVFIYGDLKEIDKEWKKYSKQYLNVSWKKKKEYFSAVTGSASTISPESVLLYSRINFQNNLTELSMSVSDDQGNFASDKNMPKEWNSVNSFLLDFAKSYYISKIDNDIKDLKKEIATNESSKNKLMQEREKLEKSTITSSKDFTQEQQNILKTRDKIAKEQNNLVKIEKKIAEVSTGSEDGDNNLKKLQLEKEEINGKIQTLTATISSAESVMSQNSSDIDSNNQLKQQIETDIQSVLTELERLNGLIYTLDGYKSFLSKK